MQPKCEEFEQNGTIARYVAGKAASEEARAFEEHYVSCDDCFDAIVLGSGVRAVMREQAATVLTLKPRNRRTFYGLIAGVGIAAALSGILIVRSLSLSRVEALGAIGAAPEYGGVAVRASEETKSEEQFAAGMTAYNAGQYREAANRLGDALQAGLEPLPAAFFLGVSQLKLNAASEAASSFNRVIAEGASPYSAEAHYYLAKALLKLRRADEALQHLNNAAKLAEPIAPRARALADSVQEVSSRFF